MVVAVRCPNPKCRKYMLVEDGDRGKVVDCLICKKPIGVPADPAAGKPAVTMTQSANNSQSRPERD
jgi:hypothetical protein